MLLRPGSAAQGPGNPGFAQEVMAARGHTSGFELLAWGTKRDESRTLREYTTALSAEKCHYTTVGYGLMICRRPSLLVRAKDGSPPSALSTI